MRLRLLLHAALLLLPSALHAQRDTVPLAELRPGQRIRVYAPEVSRDRMTGPLVRVGADTLVLLHGGETVSLPLSGIWSAQASGGRHRVLAAVAGTGVGLLAGALIGGTIGGQRGEFSDQRSDNALAGGATGALLGSVAGLAAGAARGIEFWDEVSVRARAGTGGGAGLSFSIATP